MTCERNDDWCDTHDCLHEFCGHITVQHFPFRILHADPVVYLPADELEWARDNPNLNDRMQVVGDVLTINDHAGSRYVYRIDWSPTKVWTNPKWLHRCEWPD